MTFSASAPFANAHRTAVVGPARAEVVGRVVRSSAQTLGEAARDYIAPTGESA